MRQPTTLVWKSYRYMLNIGPYTETKSRADIYAQVLWAKQQVMTHIGRLCQPLSRISCHLKLITLGSDGPNVNKSIWNKFNADKKKFIETGMLNVGTCNIHIIHNAFLKGLQVFGEESFDFVILMHSFFDGLPACCEDYQKCQIKWEYQRMLFIKHVPSHWLMIGRALARIMQQWPAIFPELCAERKKTEETSAHSQISEDYDLHQKCNDEGATWVCSSLSRTVHEFHSTVLDRRASHSCSALTDQKTGCDTFWTGLYSRFHDRDRKFLTRNVESCCKNLQKIP